MVEPVSIIMELGLYIVDLLVNGEPGKSLSKRVRELRKVAITKAMINASNRLKVKWQDDRLWNSVFNRMPRKQDKLDELRVAIGEFYSRPIDEDVKRVLGEVLQGYSEFPVEKIRSAVNDYIDVLSEELLMVDNEFGGKYRDLILIRYAKQTASETTISNNQLLPEPPMDRDLGKELSSQDAVYGPQIQEPEQKKSMSHHIAKAERPRTSSYRRRLRVIIASPVDVLHERDIALKAIARVNDTLRALQMDYYLEAVDDRMVVPDAGNPQRVTAAQLMIEASDILICIYGYRFGSPPGTRRADGTSYISGTQEEFEIGFRLNQESSDHRPRIMVYRKKDALPPNPVNEAVRQYSKLLDFVEDCGPNGKHPTYIVEFETDKLEDLLFGHLLEVSEKLAGQNKRI